MTRMHLLGAASAAALACFSSHSYAQQSSITGGGSTLAEYDYGEQFTGAEMNIWNTDQTGATFSTYWPSGSGAGQSALLTDDLSCDINKVNGDNGGNCDGGSEQGAPGNTVDYGASDATLSASQISGWATFTYGQPAAGNLIQLPSMGVGIAIPVQNTAVTGNGKLVLNDSDLCGVFSGKLTDFSQLTLGKGSVTPTAGAITVVYRSDGSGTSFLLTNHLSAVCTTGNGGNSNITFTATTTFATLFPNGTPPSNFIGEKGSGGVADELETLPSGMAYLSPDYTTIDPNSGAQVNGGKSTLVVAAQLNGSAAELPTTKEITAALAHPVSGQNLTPPQNAQEGANPTAWVPLIQTVSTGYPIVGYTTFDFAQCYADKTVAAAVRGFIKDHYDNASYKSVQATNGFVTVSSSGAAKFLEVIIHDIIGDKGKWHDDIQDKTACKGLPGR
jgi:phosphate transport system substrate-binding protein